MFVQYRNSASRPLVLEMLAKDGMALQWVGNDVRNDPEAVTTAVRANGLALQYASSKLRADATIVLAAIEKKAHLARNVLPSKMRNSVEFARVAVQQDGRLLRWFNSRVRKEMSICRLAVDNDGTALEFCGSSPRDDREIVTTAVSDDKRKAEAPLMLRFASARLRNDLDVVTAATNCNAEAFQYASDRLRKNEDLNTKCIKRDFAVLQFTSVTNDDALKRLAALAIEQCPSALEFVPEHLKTRKFVMNVVRRNGMMLRYAPLTLRDDWHVVKRAVTCESVPSGDALEHASKRLRDNLRLVKQAVQNSDEGLALQYASVRLRGNSNVVRAAVKHDYDAYRFASTKLRRSGAFFKRCCKLNGGVMYFIHGYGPTGLRLRDLHRLRNNDAVVMDAVASHGNVLRVVHSRFRDDFTIVLHGILSGMDGVLEWGADRLRKHALLKKLDCLWIRADLQLTHISSTTWIRESWHLTRLRRLFYLVRTLLKVKFLVNWWYEKATTKLHESRFVELDGSACASMDNVLKRQERGEVHCSMEGPVAKRLRTEHAGMFGA